MRHKRATDLWRSDPARVLDRGAFIAFIALTFIATLLAMVAYAHAQPVFSTDRRLTEIKSLSRDCASTSD